jgi:hypothetical protein
MLRQGDVLIVPLGEDAVPDHAVGAVSEPRDGRGRLVLALGEVTGHAHAVVGPGRLGLRVGRPIDRRVLSAVHGSEPLPPGHHQAGAEFGEPG